jgi:hypothetical protein
MVPQRFSSVAEADVRVIDGRAWVLAVGRVDAARAAAIAAVVNELSGRRTLRRVSVDLTCAVPVDPAATATLGLVRLGAPPRVDVVGPYVLTRLRGPKAAA